MPRGEPLIHTLHRAMEMAYRICDRFARASGQIPPPLLLLVDARGVLTIGRLVLPSRPVLNNADIPTRIQEAAAESGLPDIEVLVLVVEGTTRSITVDITDEKSPLEYIRELEQDAQAGPDATQQWSVAISGETIEGDTLEAVLLASLDDDRGLTYRPLPLEDDAPVVHSFHPMFAQHRPKGGPR